MNYLFVVIRNWIRESLDEWVVLVTTILETLGFAGPEVAFIDMIFWKLRTLCGPVY